jgi:hypothetical protein
MRPSPVQFASLILLALGGCAASVEPVGYSLASGSDAPTTTAATSAPAPIGASTAKAPAYALSEEENGLDCRRINGRMKIRIMQLRDQATRTRTSELSRGLQTATSQFGGSGYGSSPDSEHARDRAMLEAYNGLLASKGCKTFDLEAELKP